jgi:hypothetical protein
VFVRLDVVRGSHENKSRVLATPTRRKSLPEHARHFMRFSVRIIMLNAIDARMRHVLARLEFITYCSHAQMLFAAEYPAQVDLALRGSGSPTCTAGASAQSPVVLTRNDMR